MEAEGENPTPISISKEFQLYASSLTPFSSLFIVMSNVQRLSMEAAREKNNHLKQAQGHLIHHWKLFQV